MQKTVFHGLHVPASRAAAPVATTLRPFGATTCPRWAGRYWLLGTGYWLRLLRPEAAAKIQYV